ncbi:MAG TPA: GNAT family N-acetyltransferase [Pyrinomonadaceae bacterium]|jgi:ribosomal-protein-alanine N-acetyltransferase
MDEIETTRLRLRQFTPDDLDDLADIFSDALVLKYLAAGTAATREETEVALLSMIRHWQRNGYGRWAAIDRATQKLIGYGGLRSFDGTPELVYLLDRPYWGIGLATEIALACLEYGFMRHRFERIIGFAKPGNLASRRVLEKVGMKFERHDRFFNIDVVVHSLTRSSYLSQSLIARPPASVACNLSPTAPK